MQKGPGNLTSTIFNNVSGHLKRLGVEDSAFHQLAALADTQPKSPDQKDPPNPEQKTSETKEPVLATNKKQIITPEEEKYISEKEAKEKPTLLEINNWSKQGVNQILVGFEKNPPTTFKQIIVRHIEFSTSEWKIFCKLVQLNLQLTTLIMTDCNLADETLQPLMTALTENISARNKLKRKDVSDKFHTLNLSNNFLHDKSAEVIANFIKLLGNERLTILHLENLNFTDVGYKYLFEAMIARARAKAQALPLKLKLGRKQNHLTSNSHPELSKSPAMSKKTIMQFIRFLPVLLIRDIELGDYCDAPSLEQYQNDLASFALPLVQASIKTHCKLDGMILNLYKSADKIHPLEWALKTGANGSSVVPELEKLCTANPQFLSTKNSMQCAFAHRIVHYHDLDALAFALTLKIENNYLLALMNAAIFNKNLHILGMLIKAIDAKQSRNENILLGAIGNAITTYNTEGLHMLLTLQPDLTLPIPGDGSENALTYAVGVACAPSTALILAAMRDLTTLEVIEKRLTLLKSNKMTAQKNQFKEIIQLLNVEIELYTKELRVKKQAQQTIEAPKKTKPQKVKPPIATANTQPIPKKTETILVENPKKELKLQPLETKEEKFIRILIKTLEQLKTIVTLNKASRQKEALDTANEFLQSITLDELQTLHGPSAESIILNPDKPKAVRLLKDIFLGNKNPKFVFQKTREELPQLFIILHNDLEKAFTDKSLGQHRLNWVYENLEQCKGSNPDTTLQNIIVIFYSISFDYLFREKHVKTPYVGEDGLKRFQFELDELIKSPPLVIKILSRSLSKELEIEQLKSQIIAKIKDLEITICAKQVEGFDPVLEKLLAAKTSEAKASTQVAHAKIQVINQPKQVEKPKKLPKQRKHKKHQQKPTGIAATPALPPSQTTFESGPEVTLEVKVDLQNPGHFPPLFSQSKKKEMPAIEPVKTIIVAEQPALLANEIQSSNIQPETKQEIDLESQQTIKALEEKLFASEQANLHQQQHIAALHSQMQHQVMKLVPIPKPVYVYYDADFNEYYFTDFIFLSREFDEFGNINVFYRDEHTKNIFYCSSFDNKYYLHQLASPIIHHAPVFVPPPQLMMHYSSPIGIQAYPMQQPTGAEQNTAGEGNEEGNDYEEQDENNKSLRI